MVSLVVVALFLLLVLAAATSGWSASDWQSETRRAERAADLPRPGRAEHETLAIAAPTGPNADISAVDPLAPRYKEWARRRRSTRPRRRRDCRHAALRRRPARPRRACQGRQGRAGLDLRRRRRGSCSRPPSAPFLGALSGYFGGKVGDFLEWVYNVFTAIPGILLIFAFAAVFGRGIGSVVLILGLAGWTGIYRLIRAEFIKHSVRDYVRSAEAIGAGNLSRMFRHILPNVSHVVLVQLSIFVVGFIKSEVILSYLGLGVGVDQVSWGTMLAEAQSELILGYWWQLAAATILMAVFVTAFSLMTDALRDALDPKLRGLE